MCNDQHCTLKCGTKSVDQIDEFTDIFRIILIKSQHRFCHRVNDNKRRVSTGKNFLSIVYVSFQSVCSVRSESCALAQKEWHLIKTDTPGLSPGIYSRFHPGVALSGQIQHGTGAQRRVSPKHGATGSECQRYIQRTEGLAMLGGTVKAYSFSFEKYARNERRWRVFELVWCHEPILSLLSALCQDDYIRHRWCRAECFFGVREPGFTCCKYDGPITHTIRPRNHGIEYTVNCIRAFPIIRGFAGRIRSFGPPVGNLSQVVFVSVAEICRSDSCNNISPFAVTNPGIKSSQLGGESGFGGCFVGRGSWLRCNELRQSIEKLLQRADWFPGLADYFQRDQCRVGFVMDGPGDAHDSGKIMHTLVGSVVCDKTLLRSRKLIKRAIVHTPISVPSCRTAYRKEVGRRVPRFGLRSVVPVNEQSPDFGDLGFAMTAGIDHDKDTILVFLVVEKLTSHLGRPASEILPCVFIVIGLCLFTVGEETPIDARIWSASKEFEEPVYRIEIYVVFRYRHRVSDGVKCGSPVETTS